MSYPIYPEYKPSPIHFKHSENWLHVTDQLYYQPSTHCYHNVPKTESKEPVPKTYKIRHFLGMIPLWSTTYTRPDDLPSTNSGFFMHNGELSNSQAELLQLKPRLVGAGNLENNMSFLSNTLQRETISTDIAHFVTPQIREGFRMFPWSLSTTMQHTLQSYGIGVHHLGSQIHPHPAHKSIEQHLLFYHWSNLATEPSSVMFMKPSKFERLQNRNANFQELCNYHLTIKDKTRYPVAQTHLPTKKILFMHDGLMYFSPGSMVDLFLRCPQLETVYATLVVPPESDFTHKSMQPSLYTYHVRGDQLHYHPEGHHGGSYTQPLKALEWLKTTMITSEEIDLAVSILDSWGPCHSIMIQRGVPPIHAKDSAITFRTPQCVLIPNPIGIDQGIRDRLVPTPVFDHLFTYTRAVRTLRVTDPAGFIRIQENKPEYDWVTASAWENLVVFSLLTVGYKPRVLHDILNTHWLRLKFAFYRNYHAHPYLWSAPVVGSSMVASSALAFITTFPWYYDILQFGLLKKWIINLTPTIDETTGLATRASWFTFKCARKTVDLPFGDTLIQKLALNVPEFRACIKDKPFSSGALKYYILAGILPLLGYGLYLLFKSDSSQEAYDEYTRKMHPDDFVITLKQTPKQVLRETFLPGLNFTEYKSNADDSKFVPPTAPVKNSESTEESAHKPNVPSPNFPTYNDYHASAESLTKLSSISASQPTLSNCIKNDIQRFEVTGSLPSIPSITITAATPFTSNTSMLSSEPLTMTTPSNTTKENSASHEPSQSDGPFSNEDHAQLIEISHGSEETKPKERWSDIMEETSSVVNSIIPNNTQLPTSSQNTPESFSKTTKQWIATQTSIRKFTSLPNTVYPTTKEFNRALLHKDSSATGPTQSFQDLCKANWYPGSAMFPCRARIASPSKAPYPTGRDCLLVAFGAGTKLQNEQLWQSLCNLLPDCMLDNDEINAEGLSTDHLSALCFIYNAEVKIYVEDTYTTHYNYGIQNAITRFSIRHTERQGNICGHFQFIERIPTLTGGSHDQFTNHVLSFKYQNQLLPFLRVHKYQVQPHRAQNLSSNLKSGYDGVMGTADPNAMGGVRARFLAFDQYARIAIPRTVNLIHLAGFAGCGKTLPVAKLLQTPPMSDYRVAVPTTELRSEWKKILNLPAKETWRVNTWESSLLKTSTILVIDEVYKMPRGYLDLILIADQRIQSVILLGDPMQGEYHSLDTGSTNKQLTSEIEHLKPYIDCYCLWSYRVPLCIAGLFAVPTYSKEPGSVVFRDAIPTGSKVICNSHDAMLILRDVGQDATTISASQGSTYEDMVCIQLDRSTTAISNAFSYVALTRSKKGICFTGDVSYLSGKANSNHLFSAAFGHKRLSFKSVFAEAMPKCVLLNEPLTSRRAFKLTGKHS